MPDDCNIEGQLRYRGSLDHFPDCCRPLRVGAIPLPRRTFHSQVPETRKRCGDWERSFWRNYDPAEKMRQVTNLKEQVRTREQSIPGNERADPKVRRTEHTYAIPCRRAHEIIFLEPVSIARFVTLRVSRGPTWCRRRKSPGRPQKNSSRAFPKK